MDVSIDKLRAAANALLSHLERSGVATVTISEDYYWDVPEQLRYDAFAEPSEHTIGQLSFDIRELELMLTGERPLMGFGLVWLAAILRRVGETVAR